MYRRQLILMILAAISLLLWLWKPLTAMWDMWVERPEYSHSMLLLPLAAWLAWRSRSEWLPHMQSSNVGIAIAIVGAVFALLGSFSALFVLAQYGFVFMLIGMLVAISGLEVARRAWIVYALLLLMVPLPAFLLNSLSSQLQLLSSQLGVAFMRLFGVTVYLEGNVIDLGVHKLEVAEACDGLRYIFPLLTLGFVLAYFFRTLWWKRTLLFMAAIPVAILMNGLRVGTIGLLVERWGPAMAEGAFHEFQGWLLFMCSFALLFVLMKGIARFGSDGGPWQSQFSLDSPARSVATVKMHWPARRALAGTVTPVLLLLIGSVGAVVPARAAIAPARASFSEWAIGAAGWSGRRSALEPVYLNALKLDDYLLADYRDVAGGPVNLYVAYYDSQSGGQSAHSPRSCLPGGGWRIQSMTTSVLTAASADRPAIYANRVLIEQGRERALVYYWFKQRNRVVTNELMVKWYILWDALWRNRTDGALVRLTAPIFPGETEASVDARLAMFATKIAPELQRFVPD